MPSVKLSCKHHYDILVLLAATAAALAGSSLGSRTPVKHRALPHFVGAQRAGIDQSHTLRKEIVTPVLIDQSSYNQLHQHVESQRSAYERISQWPEEPKFIFDSEEKLLITFSAFGRTVTLSLKPRSAADHKSQSAALASNPLVIELNASSTISSSYMTDDSGVDYIGTVDEYDDSQVFINADRRGLSGFIFMTDAHFIIEPMLKSTENQDDDVSSHPTTLVDHIVYIDRAEPENPSWLESFAHESSPPAPTRKSREQDYEEKLPVPYQTTSSGTYRHVGASSAAILKRRRRSVSKERHVETMVVADKSMVDYHGRENVQHYVLALMKAVISIYQEESLGNLVNIHLTKIVILVEDQPNLTVVHNADKSLDSFCWWQTQFRKGHAKATGSGDHDVAILLTRVDICTNADEPCGTIGLAPVAGMCQPERSCSIIEDIGLGTAFIIAHEMGHMFGIAHDGVGNECGSDGYDAARIMAMHMTLSKDLFTWSNCSRHYITTFLDSGRGRCLDNKPHSVEMAGRKPWPGEVYSADEQCKYQFHDESTVCKERDICRELWCTTQEGFCLTNGFPAADGTRCRTRRVKSGWCVQGKCMEYGKQPQPVDGSWGAWSSWGRCSRSCGGGIASSHRNCDSPRPQNGGRYCLGERSRYASCNVQDCPANSTELRAVQCTQTNSAPFRGEYYQWMPFHAPHVNPCSLFCMATGYNFYTERASKVIDGTPCQSDFPYGTCVNGECVKVGCDRVIGSTATEDQCQVCKGDNTSCNIYTGLYSIPYRDSGYHEILRVPKGSVNIRIEEVSFSINYLAVRNKLGTYYLNGVYTIDWPRRIYAAGSLFIYSRIDNHPEELTCSGPIDEDLLIMVLFQGFNPGVKWQYSLTISNSTQNDTTTASLKNKIKHEWQIGNWSECSASCAGGQQVARPLCVRSTNGSEADEALCQASEKPEPRYRICGLQPCPASWTVGRWSECSQDCGSGKRYRQVVCMQKTSQASSDVVDDSLCLEPRPLSEEGCKEASCPTVWRLGNWSTCSVTCGRGWQSREVSCLSVPSGKATVISQVPPQVLLPDGQCRHTQKPTSRQSCTSGRTECPPSAMWVTGEWSKCTVTCGNGVQSRIVMCTTSDGKVSNFCEQSSRPAAVQDCTAAAALECRAASTSTAASRSPVTTTRPLTTGCNDDPKVTYCPLVKELSFCNRSFFRELCCRTCTT